MTIKGMHYDLKSKLNKIDSQQYKNFRIPEIDWKLNEAIDIYIKKLFAPRGNNFYGFEVNQRLIDDLRPLVIDNKKLLDIVEETNKFIVFKLPEDYMFYISSHSLLGNEECPYKRIRTFIRQHDDMFNENTFYNTSYEWGEINGYFTSKGLKIFKEDGFTIKSVYLNYYRKHKYVHNAEDFLPNSTYTHPDGNMLVGTQDCELPEHTHREIVDLAVLNMAGELLMPDYNIKLNKLKINEIN